METSTFSFCAPCIYVSDTETFRCTCSLSISKCSVSIHLVNSADISNVVSLALNSYQRIKINGISLTLLSPTLPSVSFVFLENHNFYRFLFSLVESSAIAPERQNYFKIMQTNLFVPNANYMFVSSEYHEYIYFLITSNMRRIKAPFQPPSTEYFDLVALLYHKRTYQAYQKYLQAHPKMDVSSRPINKHNILNWLNLTAPPKIGRCKILISRFERQSFSTETDILLQMVEQDAAHSVQYATDPRWNNKMKNFALTLLRAYIMNGDKYMNGQFEIAQKVVLLMNSGKHNNNVVIQNDNSENPSFFDEMSESDLNDFSLSTFSLIVSLFKRYDLTLPSTALQQMSENVFDLFGEVLPEFRVWFLVHNIDILLHALDEFSMIYANQFQNVWKVWQWILSSQIPGNAFVAFVAAVTFFAFPKLVKLSLSKPEDLLKDELSKLTDEMDMDDVLNFAHYLMRKSKWRRANTDCE